MLTELWSHYAETKSVETRNKIAEHYIHFVSFLAHRLMMQKPPHMSEDDLFQIGIFGLLEAIERYNPEQGAQFETYASLRIQGAILDQIRSHVRANGGLSRSAKTKSKLIEKKIMELRASLEREPTTSEIAQSLNLSTEEYYKILGEVSLGVTISLDEFVNNELNMSKFEVIKDDKAPTPEEEFLRSEKYRLLDQSIEELPEREKMILYFYYYEELTLKEIGKYYALSEARISQLHNEAILRLRTKMMDTTRG